MGHYSKQVQVFVIEALFVLCCFPVIVAGVISQRKRRREYVENVPYNLKGRGPRKSDLPNAKRRRRLTLPLSAGSKALRTADQSQCNLLSKLPTEIRQLIWIECLGQMTFHLKIEDRKLRHTRCCSPTPASCNGCYRYRKGSQQNTHLLSLPLTCRQIYSEAIFILYSTNTFVTEQISTVEYLPLVFLASRHDAITSIRLEWYLTDYGPGSLTSKTSFQMKQWVAIWRILTNMKSLQHLHVIMCYPGSIWEGLSKMDAAEVVRPIMAITKPQNFKLDLPFTCPSDEAPWVDLPCQIGRAVSFG
ncbi:hypothetical protein OIDMADRAFT_56405 [Oidiodendron maius Zn]|uniref:DUF7730 domain-containing protein n=1 Tax=Oidiodendron maius (strain Zn) TaxID=913774 RepID=A0A0C3GT91_OIDMZ|nr:hypothetical protein OIDMADRAFT_56405 [Oidiodendron maius Zn]